MRGSMPSDVEARMISRVFLAEIYLGYETRQAIGYLLPASGAWLANHELNDNSKRALGLAEPLKRRSSL